MKFLKKCGFNVLPSGGIIMGVILSTITLTTTLELPNEFYVKHLIICLGGYALGCILASVMYNLVYFIYIKIKKSK